MEKQKKEVITIKGIEQLFKISRATFYQQYKKNVLEVPSVGKKCLFDYESVKEFHEKRNKKKSNSNYKIIA